MAADYALVGEQVWYGYQGGLDPAFLPLEPGRLGFIATLQCAIERRVVAYDFLRGNEPYKAHFGAEPRPTVAVRVVSPRASARLRNQAWLAGQEAKRWLKQKLLSVRTMTSAAGPA
jgi:CelD/BcsL family acetyltransferase involved in cellulose biosynthesis